MMHFFPSAYPDELWYSIISRYHVRSGNATSQITNEQLFHGRGKVSIGSFFPNNTIYLLSKNLSDDVFDIQNIVLNHTLLKYFCRMYSKEEKKDILKKICYGKAETLNMKLDKSKTSPNYLKFCPLCKREDVAEYEESYWHLSHQLPKINICVKHKCRLIPVFFDNPLQLYNRFMVPDENLEYEVDYHIVDIELQLAKTYVDYLCLPFLVGPTTGYNNLYQGLLNNGYGTGVQNNVWALNSIKIYADLVDVFGTDIVNDMFGNQLTNSAMRDLKHWIVRSPERYILISCLINQRAKMTFSTKEIEDQLKKKLLALSNENRLMQKSHVARYLGLSMKSLETVAKYYNVSSFWTKGQQYLNNRQTDLIVSLTDSEKKVITKFYKENGYQSCSQFLRYCMSRVVDFTQDL